MITFGKFNLETYADCHIVTDAKLAKLYGIKGANVFLLPQGEQAKSWKYVQQLCSWLLSRRAEKNQLVVAIGGGSIGDTVGFAASVYKRGIKLLHVPTTFIAQTDSSIGGKTAIDCDGVKNAVGTFYAADTLIDIDFLKTLDETQRKNGFGELLKYRMLDDNVNNLAMQGNTKKIVEACVAYKRRICKKDPFDNNERKVLNFGHTIGHALELSLKLSHGEAVANGLFYETLLAYKLGMCSAQYLVYWKVEIEQHFQLQALSSQLLDLVTNDKKTSEGKACFALPAENGFEIRYLAIEEVSKLLCND